MKTSKKIIELILTIVLSITTFTILFIIFWVYSISSDEKISDDYKKYEVSDDSKYELTYHQIYSYTFAVCKDESEKESNINTTTNKTSNNTMETALLLVMGTVTIIILIYQKSKE